MVGGPRLDTPSAVGDEGRPRATSLTIAALVVAAFGLATGILRGDPQLFSGVALLTGVAVAGMTLLDRETLGPTVIGHLCFLPAASGVLASLVISPVATALIGGVVLAMVGVATGWTNVLGTDTVAATTVSSALSYLFAVVGIVVLVVAAAIAWVCWRLLTAVVGATSPVAVALGLGALVFVSAICLFLALWQLPVLQLTARSRQAERAATLTRFKRALGAVGLGAGVLTVLTPFVVVFTPLDRVLAAPPFSTVVGLLSSWFVLGPVVAVTVGALLAATGAFVLRTVTTEFDHSSVRTVGAVVAALGYLLLLAPVLLRLSIVSANPAAVFAAAILLPLAVYLVLVLALGALKFGLLPERAAPAALTAAGLICASIGAAQADLPALLVFAGVAGGLVAWDVGTYGLGLTAELGHRPETRRLELYHGVFAVGVGVVGVLLLSVVEIARQSAGPAVGSSGAMAVAVLGVLLLLAPLRG